MRDFSLLITDNQLTFSGEAMAHVVAEYGLASYEDAVKSIIQQDPILAEWDRIIKDQGNREFDQHHRGFLARIARDEKRSHDEFEARVGRMDAEAHHRFARMELEHRQRHRPAPPKGEQR